MQGKNLNDIKAAIESIGLPVAYHHFKKSDSPIMPYICYVEDGKNPFFADGEVYYQSTEIAVGLYAKSKNTKIENDLEKIFSEHALLLSKECYYIENENVYETIYKGEI